jgi:hypothetical protein
MHVGCGRAPDLIVDWCWPNLANTWISRVFDWSNTRISGLLALNAPRTAAPRRAPRSPPWAAPAAGFFFVFFAVYCCVLCGACAGAGAGRGRQAVGRAVQLVAGAPLRACTAIALPNLHACSRAPPAQAQASPRRRRRRSAAPQIRRLQRSLP